MVATLAPLRRPNLYIPHGASDALFGCRDDEVIVDGPAGTGKSRGCLEKLYGCAQKYPGMRALICRKTRESLTESALVTFESHVLPKGLPWASNQQRRVRQSYELPNGSEIVVGGLDKSSKIMSTEYDLIYVQEARECTEADWEDLTTRLRNGVMPYQQIIGDTNPDAPGHWIKRREHTKKPGTNVNKLTLIPSRHTDNPTVTPQYLARLDALTGVRRARLRDGLWTAAENMVYTEWDPTVHLVDAFEIPPAWPRYRSVDFGYTNSFVCQWWAEDPDGRLYLYREVCGVQRLVKDWGHLIFDLTWSETIRATITDHDVEGRADLEAHMGHSAEQCGQERYAAQQMTTAALKDVSIGIEHVAGRLHVAGDGKPRLMIFRDALAFRDEALDESKRPIGFAEEVESYAWDRANSQKYGDVLLEQPLKKDDHSMDACRYMVEYLADPRGAWARAIGSSAQIGYGEPPKPHPFGAAREEMERDRQRQERRRTERRLERRAY